MVGSLGFIRKGSTLLQDLAQAIRIHRNVDDIRPISAAPAETVVQLVPGLLDLGSAKAVSILAAKLFSFSAARTFPSLVATSS
jgi:hypothetical protein